MSKATCVIEIEEEEGSTTMKTVEFKGTHEVNAAEEGISGLMEDIQSLRVQVNQFLTEVIAEKEKKIPPPPMKKKKDGENDDDGDDDDENDDDDNM